MVGNYNRLMAELNVLLTPIPANVQVSDTSDRRTAAFRVIDELATYWWSVTLDKEETEEMQQRLGAFATDSTLTQFKSNLQRAVTSPYPTDEGRDLSMLAQIGVGANAGNRGGGYSVSQMRGYLEIDEKKLDEAIERNLPAIKQLFGSDTSGDLIADTGAAFNIDSLTRPFVETGGIVALKTGSIDSRISQDTRRIETMDRQLVAKEAALKAQFSRMESAYARMEQMSSSLENFGRQNSNNR